MKSPEKFNVTAISPGKNMMFMCQNALNLKFQVQVTHQEALLNLKEAVELYLENAKLLWEF